jgi:hypothetical protein
MLTEVFKLNIIYKTIHINKCSFKSIARQASFLVHTITRIVVCPNPSTSLFSGRWCLARATV